MSRLYDIFATNNRIKLFFIKQNPKNLMKIFNLVTNIVIIIAFVLIWILHPKGQSTESSSEPSDYSSVCQKLPIAYVNIDSVLTNYQEALDLNEELMSQQENARTTLTAKARKLEEEMVAFQRKVENNGFLTRERAQSEQQRLLKEQQDLEEMQQRMSNELALKQQDLNDQVLEAITNYINEYNEDGKYEYILTQTGGIGTVLYAKSGYNITGDVLGALNERYNAKTK